MKTLYLVRHAQAIPDESGVNDFKRMLASEGREDALIMGKRLASKGIAPDLLIASPADRALETAHIFAEKFNYPIQRILLREELYAVENATGLPRVLNDLPDVYQTVMLFGHEPALSRWANILIPDFSAELRTTGVLGISLHISAWQELSDGSGTLIFFDFPAQATPEIYNDAREAIQERLTTIIEDLLEQLEVDISKQIRKIIKKTSKNFSKELVNVLQSSKIKELVGEKNQPWVDLLSASHSETATPDESINIFPKIKY